MYNKDKAISLGYGVNEMNSNILDIKTISKAEALNILDWDIDKELLSRRDKALINKVALMLEQLIAKQ
mgnify:CR=1 FL=1